MGLLANMASILVESFRSPLTPSVINTGSKGSRKEAGVPHVKIEGGKYSGYFRDGMSSK